jgi:hypothetical protein
VCGESSSLSRALVVVISAPRVCSIVRGDGILTCLDDTMTNGENSDVNQVLTKEKPGKSVLIISCRPETRGFTAALLESILHEDTITKDDASNMFLSIRQTPSPSPVSRHGS